jgi:hypothetical protein
LQAFEAYFEPIGYERGDWQAAHIAACGFGGNGRTRDYVLKFREPFREVDGRERSERIKASMAEMRAGQQARKAAHT